MKTQENSHKMIGKVNIFFIILVIVAILLLFEFSNVGMTFKTDFPDEEKAESSHLLINMINSMESKPIGTITPDNQPIYGKLIGVNNKQGMDCTEKIALIDLKTFEGDSAGLLIFTGNCDGAILYHSDNAHSEIPIPIPAVVISKNDGLTLQRMMSAGPVQIMLSASN